MRTDDSHSRLVSMLVALIATLHPWPQAPASDPIGQLSKAISHFEASLNNHEYFQVGFMTHPKVAELVGGAVQVAKQMEAAFDFAAARGGGMRSLRFGEPGGIVEFSGAIHSVVPYDAVLSQDGLLYAMKSFYIAYSPDNGRTWYFVDGSGANPRAMDQIFPGHEGKLVLPPRMELEPLK